MTRTLTAPGRGQLGHQHSPASTLAVRLRQAGHTTLTPAELRCWLVLATLRDVEGYAPGVQDVAEALGVHVFSAHKQVLALRSAGLIEPAPPRKPGARRGAARVLVSRVRLELTREARECP